MGKLMTIQSRAVVCSAHAGSLVACGMEKGRLDACPQSSEELLTGSEALSGFLPVHNIPPCADVVRAAILILQIIGVLPDIQPDHRVLRFHDGRILVSGRAYVQLP